MNSLNSLRSGMLTPKKQKTTTTITGTSSTYATVGNYTCYKFLTTGGTLTIANNNQSLKLYILAVAGGGGAGGGSGSGGGGGAGGFLENIYTISATSETVNITIGAGGNGGEYNNTSGFPSSGGNTIVSSTTIGTIDAVGGGNGQARGKAVGSGGSGGGASTQINPSSTGGSGTSGQGNNGGSATYGTSNASGTGGGAGGVGTASSNSTGTKAGGAGKSVTNTSVFSNSTYVYSAGGTTTRSNPTTGPASTTYGSGGNGGFEGSGSAGFKGICMISILTSQVLRFT